MRSIVRSTLAALALAGAAYAADVHVGINVGVPPPPAFVIPAPPRLVAVPATPVVQYAPELSVNFFAYGGNDGAWFVASAYNGPWTYVDYARVPRPVRVVPYRYYRVPPGHAKRYYRHGHH